MAHGKTHGLHCRLALLHRPFPLSARAPSLALPRSCTQGAARTPAPVYAAAACALGAAEGRRAGYSACGGGAQEREGTKRRSAFLERRLLQALFPKKNAHCSHAGAACRRSPGTGGHTKPHGRGWCAGKRAWRSRGEGRGKGDGTLGNTGHHPSRRFPLPSCPCSPQHPALARARPAAARTAAAWSAAHRAPRRSGGGGRERGDTGNTARICKAFQPRRIDNVFKRRKRSLSLSLSLSLAHL